MNNFLRQPLTEWVGKSVFIQVSGDDKLLHAVDVSSYSSELIEKLSETLEGTFESFRQAFLFLPEVEANLVSKVIIFRCESWLYWYQWRHIYGFILSFN